MALYGMTNALRCVILPAGSRQAPCRHVCFTMLFLFIHIDTVVQVWGLTHEKSHCLARNCSSRAGLRSSFCTSIRRSSAGRSEHREACQAPQEAEDAWQARRRFGSCVGCRHERQGHAELSCPFCLSCEPRRFAPEAIQAGWRGFPAWLRVARKKARASCSGLFSWTQRIAPGAACMDAAPGRAPYCHATCTTLTTTSATATIR